MPVYIYLCKKCGKKKEKIHKMDESPTIRCYCGQTMVIELQSTAFKLKGHGWPSKDMKKG